MRAGLVLRLVLREVAARHIPPNARKGTAAMLWESLRADIAERVGEGGAEALFTHLRDRLLEEGGFILLDGLDEVPEAQRRRATLLEAVKDLAAALPRAKSRLLLTARPYAYADPEWRLANFPILALAPFSAEQCARFIGRFYQAVHTTMNWSAETARARGERLAAALRDKVYLADLGSRPVLLTLMATLHANRGQLPEDRADLLEETAKLLLGGWQRAREVLGADGEPIQEPSIAQCLSVGEDRIRSALEALALAVHERQRGAGANEGEPADVTEADLLVAFKPLLGKLDPDALLGYLKDRSGLLIARRDGVYAFPHRSFQEHLAACRLLSREDYARELRTRIRDDPRWWREVCLLAVGSLRSKLGLAVGLIRALVPEGVAEVPQKTETHWHLAALAGQAIIELRLRERGAEEEEHAALIRRCRSWLEQLVEGGELAPRERAEAGDILGQLGDPRFGDAATCHLPARYRGAAEPLLGFVEIPAGPFVMGSRKGERDTDDDEYGNPAKLEIPYPYWIARYPVTVAQYAAFIDAHGYDERDYWTGRGWSWRSGEWDSHADGEIGKWLKRRPRPLRGEPMWWDEQRRFPNRPVYGVCWFEAQAYGKWLNAQLRQRAPAIVPDGYAVRLPTEAEWEKAARSGEAWRYPWGDTDWDENKANIENRIGHVTAVGSYPKGATPGTGLQDMAGNVWEWTGTFYRKYPYKPDDGRNDAKGEGSPVLRGGSWFLNQTNARCAVRFRIDPGYYYFYGIGFRVVVSLANSGF